MFCKNLNTYIKLLHIPQLPPPPLQQDCTIIVFNLFQAQHESSTAELTTMQSIPTKPVDNDN